MVIKSNEKSIEYIYVGADMVTVVYVKSEEEADRLNKIEREKRGLFKIDHTRPGANTGGNFYYFDKDRVK